MSLFAAVLFLHVVGATNWTGGHLLAPVPGVWLGWLGLDKSVAVPFALVGVLLPTGGL